MLDKALRNTLRIMVTEARKILEGTARAQLQGQFGIHSNGTIEPKTSMNHLSEEDQHYRDQIIAHLTHVHASGFTMPDAIAQLVREVAFTHLNRLCAYKMMESRTLIRETVSRGLKSNGFLFYLADHPNDEQLWSSGKQSLAYRHFLAWQNEKLSAEIGVLFSPADPANRLFPPQNKLDEVLSLINSTELQGIWSEDEAIGWVYQYFTPKELRDKARNESQAPRNSYELAFRNQFYTPRYVVNFLTDNTLGRTWYEMRQGQTQLKDQCRYMVRRPDEVFFAEPNSEAVEQAQQWLQGEDVPEPDLIYLAHTVNGYRNMDAFSTETNQWLKERLANVATGQAAILKTQELLDILFLTHRLDRFNEGFLNSLQTELETIKIELGKRVEAQRNENRSQEELLRAPSFVAFRAPKDPREIRILDPACGSGHFLLYCFDLLTTIYLEAFEAAKTDTALKQKYHTIEDLQRAIPGLILAHNLHGIDIDVRATQIASLALWLRAQRAYQGMQIKSSQRPPIKKSNIVCAEPMPGEKDMLEEFTNTLQPQILGKLVQTAFEKMKLASEAGSLLKIEEEIKDAVLEAKKLWLSRPKAEQLVLWSDPQNTVVQQALTNLEITDIAFWDEAEQKVIEALHTYATSLTNGGGFARQLFADDAVQGFAFINLCQKQFDVVLMNPPFGEASKPSKKYVETVYPRTKNDIYAAFVERWLDKLIHHGILGAITSRTGFFLTSFQKWREEILLTKAKPTIFADLGHGVLDTAMVGTAAYCLKADDAMKEAIFLRLLPNQNKTIEMENAIESLNKKKHVDKVIYILNPLSFHQIPGSTFAYWTNKSIRLKFSEYPQFESSEREVRIGDHPSNDFKYLRLSWEIPLSDSEHNWFPYQKGGEYSPYYSDIHLLVDWDIDRQTYREFYGRPGRSSERPSNYQYFFRPGLTWPRRTTRGLSIRALPAGCIFADKGPVIFSSLSSLLSLLGLVNSIVFKGFVNLQMAAGSYEVGVIQRTPIPDLSAEKKKVLDELTLLCVNLKRDLDREYETSHIFHLPALLCTRNNTLVASLTAWQDKIQQTEQQLSECQQAIDEIAFNLYCIDHEDRQIIEDSLNNIQLDAASEVEDEDSDTKKNVHAIDFVSELLSYIIGCSLGRWDIRFATGKRTKPELPDPFVSLPVCSPSMLIGDDGLPLDKTPAQYPLTINWDGILVDDTDHSEDIINHVQQALEIIWQDRAEEIEKETCQILSIKELREYFRRPGKGGFWSGHISTYSKSRRKAPIYWLLQSSKKNYAVWLYYHRLTKDTLFKVLNNYVEPKIRRESTQLEQLRAQLKANGPVGSEAKKLGRLVERQESSLSELEDFRDKLRRAADLNLEPDLNDGVVLNIAPLWELVPWGEARKYWEELLAGKYEWSSIGKQLREKGLV